MQIKYYLEISGKNQNKIQEFLHSAMLDIVNNWIQASKYDLYII